MRDEPWDSGIGPQSARDDLAETVAALKVHNHLCLIHGAEAERLAAIVPFLRSGIEHGECCLYLADAATIEATLEALRRDGGGTEAALASGALRAASDSPTTWGDAFDPDRLLAFLDESAAAAAASGYSALRVAGEMSWILGASADAEHLIDFEVGLHDFLPAHECRAIFQYDQRRLSADVIRDVILTHPVVIHGDRVYRNAHAVAPREFLGRDRTAQEVDRLLDVLADQKEQVADRERRALASQTEYRRLFETMAQGVVYQASDGRISDANPAAQRILGLSLAQMQGRTSVDPRWRAIREDGSDFPGEDHPAMVALRTGEAVRGVVMGVVDPRTSERTWIEVSAAPLRGAEGGTPTGAYATFDDITERRSAVQALGETSALLRGVFDVMPSGCAIYEVHGDGSSGGDYIVRYFNGAALAMEGRTEDEVVGRSLRDLRPAIDEYGLIPVFQRVWQTGEPADFPATVYVDEQYANYYENHAFRLPSGEIVAIYDDVTERETAIRSLRESGAMWRSYVENAPYGVFVTDATGHYLEVNPEACRTTGYDESELLSMSIADLIPPDSKEVGLQHFSTLLETGLSSGELLHLTKADELRWWSVSAVRLSDDRYLGFTADVTDRVLAEAGLAELNVTLDRRVQERTAELEAANAELEAFSYSVSHDLRAPLRHISGFAHLLREETGGDLSDEQHHCFARIDAAVTTMGHLIDDLIEFSRIGRSDIKRTLVDMEMLAAEAIEAVRPDGPSREIEWLVSALPPALADEAVMRLVWINLLDNAVKYTSPHPRARIEIGGRNDAAEAVYWVRDDGVGFDPAYAHKLFGVFQRLHRSEEFDGTGIGLATVRRVITRLGGRTWAEGTVEAGATFFFTLPRNAI